MNLDHFAVKTETPNFTRLHAYRQCEVILQRTLFVYLINPLAPAEFMICQKLIFLTFNIS